MNEDYDIKSCTSAATLHELFKSWTKYNNYWYVLPRYVVGISDRVLLDALQKCESRNGNTVRRSRLVDRLRCAHRMERWKRKIQKAALISLIPYCAVTFTLETYAYCESEHGLQFGASLILSLCWKQQTRVVCIPCTSSAASESSVLKAKSWDKCNTQLSIK